MKDCFKLPVMYCLSAELVSKGVNENYLDSLYLESALRGKKVSYFKCKGVYKGTKETSYLVIDHDNTLGQWVRTLAKEYNQESYLLIDEYRRVVNIGLSDGRYTSIGQWKEKQWYEVDKADHTCVEDSNTMSYRYFVAQ
jgi:hypothetical protein